MASTEETRAIVERVVDWVHSEAQRIGEQLAAAKVAEVQARLDEVIETARALLSELSQSASCCQYHDGCEALATRFFAWEGDSEALCDAHAEIILGLDPDEQPLRTADLACATHLRRLRALTSEEGV